MSKTIVIIDDDHDDLEIMGESLRRVDSTMLCISFIYPEEAIRLLAKELVLLPDFIFVDINMPKLNGIHCLRELRKIDAFSATSITIYSTGMSDTLSAELLANGATYTMLKPNKIEDYDEALKAILLGIGPNNKHLRCN